MPRILACYILDSLQVSGPDQKTTVAPAMGGIGAACFGRVLLPYYMVHYSTPINMIRRLQQNRAHGHHRALVTFVWDCV
ncbi:hypothetical protein BDW68DRAFT_156985 [Aspergillus falconensis]